MTRTPEEIYGEIGRVNRTPGVVDPAQHQHLAALWMEMCDAAGPLEGTPSWAVLAAWELSLTHTAAAARMRGMT